MGKIVNWVLSALASIFCCAGMNTFIHSSAMGDGGRCVRGLICNFFLSLCSLLVGCSVFEVSWGQAGVCPLGGMFPPMVSVARGCRGCIPRRFVPCGLVNM